MDTFAFYEGGGGGGMSHRWDGANSDTYDATNITVTLTFSSGTTVASMGLDSANVNVTASVCSTVPCEGNYYSNGYGLFTNIPSSGYVEAGLFATVTTTTDYMAGGYWLYVSRTGSYQDMEMGGFVYASSLASKSDVGGLTSGTATFDGITEGGASASADGVYRVGYVSGNVALTANFTNGSLSGKLSNLRYDWSDENRNDSITDLSDIDLTADSFRSTYATDGYVRSTGITSTGKTISGSWSATFTGSETSVMSLDDLTGIAGAYGVRITDSDNTNNWMNLIGAFIAGKN